MSTRQDRRPVIGIVGHGYDVAKPFGSLAAHGAPQWFSIAVAATGGRPVIVPPGAGIELLDVVDGLVLTGGGDVDPARYGGAPGSAFDVDAGRDADEIDVVRAAAAARIPLLGVCRGLQVLVVALGGSLRSGVDHVHPEAGHPVTTAPGSLIRALVGERATTSALHRQAIADPGPRWTPTAWTDDGVIEAIEPTADWSALGVQWHPELHWNERPHDATGPVVFDWLVRQAASRTENHSTGAALTA
ncbi:MAG: gamma-glutamyl-gamma-aminobutyrate hydrolase family protein [Propionibacteriales bacterium]|nr:gamma-glutamyl-gamma-aminobutyrate hydrolase family protein [Propionibacteriales bacterium]